MAPPPTPTFVRPFFGPGTGLVVAPGTGNFEAPPPQVLDDVDIPNVRGVLEISGHHKGVQVTINVQGIFDPHRT